MIAFRVQSQQFNRSLYECVFMQCFQIWSWECLCTMMCFRKSMEYSEKSMEEALKKVETMQADLGGTEILQPLQHIYSQPCIPKQPRQVIKTWTFMLPENLRNKMSVFCSSYWFLTFFFRRNTAYTFVSFVDICYTSTNSTMLSMITDIYNPPKNGFIDLFKSFSCSSNLSK